ncbi:hypothetical protein GCM10009533_37680 [Saccharopolyspora spinosporotrichia]|uniref:Transposase n=1 Tax=Saccharopolyspora erythraea TaxID=1836 RepID=A0ABN1D628_SACER
MVGVSTSSTATENGSWYTTALITDHLQGMSEALLTDYPDRRSPKVRAEEIWGRVTTISGEAGRRDRSGQRPPASCATRSSLAR